jgi:putative N6-adenine-specific DNA methylase
MKKFFVGCNLQFEEELVQELQEFWPYLLNLDGRPHSESLKILELVPGGVLLEASLHLGLQINLFSKLANRVLLRLQESRLRDFPKLFQTLKALQKHPFLQGLELDSEISAKESRLNNEKRIREIVQEIFGVHEASEQTLYIRFHQDLCSISLDSSGQLLHKRSQKEEQGTAPLRETLAAFAVRKLIGDRAASQLQEIELIDPMCGTGTLLREASGLYQPVPREKFAFQSWSTTPKLLKSSGLKGNYPNFPSLFARLVGFDRDPVAVEKARLLLHGFGERAQIDKRDLFKNPTSFSEPKIRWVISNPPYGERLKVDFSPLQLLQQIQKVYAPQRVGLVLSENQSRQLRSAQVDGLHIESQWPFSNGGLSVAFSIFSN